MDAVLGWVGGLGSGVYVVVATFAFLESSAFVGLVAPGETVLIFAGVLAARMELSPVAVAACGSVGATLGDSVSYEIGRHFGAGLLARIRFRRRALERAKRLFARHGGKTVFVGRFVGFARPFAPLLAGVARMPYRRFVLFNVAGAVLWAAGCTSLGWFAGAHWRLIERWIRWIGAGVALAVIALVVARWRRARRAGA
jgi:undecaprenyl-diphosphatase